MKKERDLCGSISYDTLADLVKRAEAAIEQFPEENLTLASFSIEYDRGCGASDRYATIVYSTEETLAEKFERESKAAEWAAKQKEWDRQTYEKLKAKFDAS